MLSIDPAGPDEISPPAELLRRLVGERRLDALLDLLDEQIQGIDAFHGYNILMLSPDGKHLSFERMRLPAGYERLQSIYLHTQIPLESDEPSARALAAAAPIGLDSEGLRGLSSDTQTRLELMRISALAVIPLRRPERQLGVLSLYKQGGSIGPAAIGRLQALADLVAPQLDIALDLEQVRRQELELQASLQKQQDFLAFINTVNDLTSAAELYDAIAQRFMKLYAFDLAGFALREGQELVVQRLILGSPDYAARYPALNAFYLGTRYRLDISGGGLAAAYERNAPVLVPDIQALGDMPMMPQDRQAVELMETPRTLLMAPIRRHGETLGVMWLVSLGEPVRFGESDLKLVDSLSGFVGTAIGNAQLYSLVAKQNQAIEELNEQLKQEVDELATKASTDKLTGLHNFGYFEAELQRRVMEYQRNPDGGRLSLALIDVDHFKRFNDTYGHPAGNAVLQEVARRIRSVARKMDIPCRYGGEEFIAILPRCDLDGACGFAERVRNEIAGTPFFVNGRYLSLTASAGCATYAVGETAAQLVERVDRALYAAKAAGRNRVERETQP